MKNLFSLILSTAVASLWLVSSVQAETTHVFNWTVGWVNANPDGLHERQVVGINGQWPLPVVEVNRGDRIIVNMQNNLPDKNASIHFHGMFQNGTSDMDGPTWVSQCPVPPGGNIVYNFSVGLNNGTYWYHSHVDSQYPDGYRQAFIVHDDDFPYHYDEELTVTVSDWYHETIESIDPHFLSLYNPSGAEPLPDSFLFNDTQNLKIPVKPNTTYMLRIINIGAFVGQYFYIDGHNFTIVEVDGVYTEPQDANMVYVAVAQRYAVIFTTMNSTDKNWGIVTVADQDLLDTVPSNLQLNQTNWLEYNSSAPFEQVTVPVAVSDDLEPYDDFDLVPYDHMPLLPDPDYSITATVSFNNLDNGISYAFFNNISYTHPKVPTLYTVLSANESVVTNDVIYGEFTHSWILNHNEVIEIVLNSNDTGSHPFHLHGHNFQVIQRSPVFDNPTPYDPNNHTEYPAFPIRRDTLRMNANGHFVIRFVADNPGVWFFHCHIEWHLSQGLAMTMIEAPLQLQQNLQLPSSHINACKAASLPYLGNAAANTADYLDLTSQNVQQPFLPNGFTARGIVALVFSCFTAFLGMAAITWYGLSDLSLTEKTMIREIGLSPEDDPSEEITMTEQQPYHDDE